MFRLNCMHLRGVMLGILLFAVLLFSCKVNDLKSI